MNDPSTRNRAEMRLTDRSAMTMCCLGVCDALSRWLTDFSRVGRKTIAFLHLRRQTLKGISQSAALKVVIQRTTAVKEVYSVANVFVCWPKEKNEMHWLPAAAAATRPFPFIYVMHSRAFITLKERDISAVTTQGPK